MANCHKLFIDFNRSLEVTPFKKDKLMKSASFVQHTIESYFLKNHPEYKITFKKQGSEPLGTMIRSDDDWCDLDIGVIFSPKPNVTGATLQGYVWNAVENIAGYYPEHKNKCIRITYGAEYEIDLPVCYMDDIDDEYEIPHLAVKNDGYILSDAPGFIRWVSEHSNYCPQLIRAIRYLKAFAKNADREMPTGMLFTVLATKYFQENSDRDDLMLIDLLTTIRNSHELTNWECEAPVNPYDNLLSKFNEHAQSKTKKKNLLDRLDSFIGDAESAVKEGNQRKSSILWAKHLGSRFPEGMDVNVDNTIERLSTRITSLNEGKSHISSRGSIIAGSNPKTAPVPHRNWSSICSRNSIKSVTNMAPRIALESDIRQEHINALRREQDSVRKKFPSFKTQIDYSHLVLLCAGRFIVDVTNTRYSVLILFKPCFEPYVYILDFDESPSPDLHMHADGRLCLCYPDDHKWSFQDDVVRTAFCWTSEWLYNYELYKRSGVWQSQSAPHE